jgi:predicted tellurium resistance membrane protein TerC
VGAIVVRSAMTIGVVWLLKIPGLMLVGGLASGVDRLQADAER